MIKQATGEDAARIIGINDDELLKCFTGDRGEIIQFLVAAVDAENSNIKVWINDDNGKVNAYVVAINNCFKPIADYVFIPYAYSKAGHEVTELLLGEVIKWGIELNARAVQMVTAHKELFEKYGFKESNQIIMELTIG